MSLTVCDSFSEIHPRGSPSRCVHACLVFDSWSCPIHSSILPILMRTKSQEAGQWAEGSLLHVFQLLAFLSFTSWFNIPARYWIFEGMNMLFCTSVLYPWVTLQLQCLHYRSGWTGWLKISFTSATWPSPCNDLSDDPWELRSLFSTAGISCSSSPLLW